MENGVQTKVDRKMFCFERKRKEREEKPSKMESPRQRRWGFEVNALRSLYHRPFSPPSCMKRTINKRSMTIVEQKEVSAASVLKDTIRCRLISLVDGNGDTQPDEVSPMKL